MQPGGPRLNRSDGRHPRRCAVCEHDVFEVTSKGRRLDTGGWTFYSRCSRCGGGHYRLDDGAREGFFGDIAAAKRDWKKRQEAAARAL